jgi:hypothetical protein
MHETLGQSNLAYAAGSSSSGSSTTGSEVRRGGVEGDGAGDDLSLGDDCANRTWCFRSVAGPCDRFIAESDIGPAA